MVWGSVTVSICLVVLGWTEEMVSLFIAEEALVRVSTQTIGEGFG